MLNEIDAGATPAILASEPAQAKMQKKGSEKAKQDEAAPTALSLLICFPTAFAVLPKPPVKARC